MSEKTAPIWLKILSLVLAISLAGGYVVWRNQHADRRAAAPTTTPDSEPQVLMVGSKNPGRDFLPPGTGDPADGETTPAQRALMSSSKSMIATEFIEIDPATAEDLGFDWVVQPQPAPDPAPRTILPGSKSISPLLEPLAPDPPQQDEP